MLSCSPTPLAPRRRATQAADQSPEVGGAGQQDRLGQLSAPTLLAVDSYRLGIHPGDGPHQRHVQDAAHPACGGQQGMWGCFAAAAAG